MKSKISSFELCGLRRVVTLCVEILASENSVSAIEVNIVLNVSEMRIDCNHL